MGVVVSGNQFDALLEDTPFGDLNFSRYHVFTLRTLTVEMRAYNYKSGLLGRIQIARPARFEAAGKRLDHPSGPAALLTCRDQMH